MDAHQALWSSHTRTLFTIVVSCLLLGSAIGTEDQCHRDCWSPDNRPVGPTRPWDTQDPLRNELHLTRPYPYHIGASDEYPFPEFCKLGCTYFFVSSDSDQTGKTSTLGQCLDQCDDKYSYNSPNPPHNDLAQISRLECRDGCLMALKRCQPGYYCSQVSFDGDGDGGGVFSNLEENNSSLRYQGGEMIPCPAGTYRDVDYDSVTECVPCPPNYFREDVKGRNRSSCTSCPKDTSAVNRGSSSILDCVRCSAGTFSREGEFCKCITPQACAEDQLLSPADAEKKGTVPFIGRW